MRQDMALLTSSRSNLWYTPPDWGELARRALGKIDLDPASDAIAQTWIKAGMYYSSRGLERRWFGRVFINPPYGKTNGRSNQKLWTLMLRHLYLTRQVDAGIILTKTVPGYVWWDDLFHGAWPGPCCITRGRIPFVNGDQGWLPWTIRHEEPETVARWLLDRWRKKGKASKAASTFWYCGPEPELFAEVFQEVGRVIEPARWRWRFVDGHAYQRRTDDGRGTQEEGALLGQGVVAR